MARKISSKDRDIKNVKNPNAKTVVAKKDYSGEIANLGNALSQAETNIADMESQVAIKNEQIERLNTAADELSVIWYDSVYMINNKFDVYYLIEGWSSNEYSEVTDYFILDIIDAFETYYARINEIIEQIDTKIKDVENEINSLNSSINFQKLIADGLKSQINNLKAKQEG